MERPRKDTRTGSSVKAKIGARQSDLCRPIENQPILSTSTVAIVSKREVVHQLSCRKGGGGGFGDDC